MLLSLNDRLPVLIEIIGHASQSPYVNYRCNAIKIFPLDFSDASASRHGSGFGSVRHCLHAAQAGVHEDTVKPGKSVSSENFAPHAAQAGGAVEIRERDRKAQCYCIARHKGEEAIIERHGSAFRLQFVADLAAIDRAVTHGIPR
jgi:hypothetical protein